MVALRNVRAFGKSGASLQGLVISYLKVACDVCKDTDLEDISKRVVRLDELELHLQFS